MALLARRDFAVRELADRLAEGGHAGDAIETVLAELTAGSILDDARFASHYVSYHADRGQGPWRIARDLRTRKVAEGVIEAALAEPDWPALAREVRIRRFGLTPPKSWPDKARQARFLQYRGFSSDHIRSAIGPDFDPDGAP
ncbi:MAG TPA: regulatory protein RecX [Steroidobacteraceae bacterium]|nr:regulatory protein RecX [Steroidobacteraceae bacterium]